MGYFVFRNGESAANDTNLNVMQQGLLELVFPVGSTYITQSNTNPNTILNFGTWERLKGKVCIGLDEDDEDEYFDEIGKIGGEKKHTMTLSELVNHDHSASGGGKFVEDGGTGSNIYTSAGESYATKIGSSITAKTGGGQSFNVTQPYEVVGYMWIRRS